MDNNGQRTYRYNKMFKPDNITVLDIYQFTVDVTLKSSRLYKSLKNEIHLKSGRKSILSMSDGLYMEHFTKIRILLTQCKNW